MKKISLKGLKITVPVFKDISEAFRLIQWPTVQEIGKQLLAVLVISAIIGAYLGGLDSLFGNLRNAILFN